MYLEVIGDESVEGQHFKIQTHLGRKCIVLREEKISLPGNGVILAPWGRVRNVDPGRLVMMDENNNSKMNVLSSTSSIK